MQKHTQYNYVYLYRNTLFDNNYSFAQFLYNLFDNNYSFAKFMYNLY